MLLLLQAQRAVPRLFPAMCAAAVRNAAASRRPCAGLPAVLRRDVALTVGRPLGIPAVRRGVPPPAAPRLHRVAAAAAAAAVVLVTAGVNIATMDEGQAGAASPDAGPAPTKPMIVFTPAVLAEHCTAESCWLAIEGGVYDVTGYLGSHPGGAGVILAAAGTDATAQFSAFHRRAVLSEVAAQFRIGTMAGETRTAVTVDTAPEADAGDTEGYVEDRISAVMDGSKGAGFGSHTVTRCTAAELRALQNVSQIGAEAVRRGPPALVSG